jgi:hypothetical protein
MELYYNTCIIGVTFLLASVYIAIFDNDKKNKVFIKFMNLLNNEQRKKYQQVVQERVKIYVIALLSGLGAALLFYYRYPEMPYKICTFLAIAYVTKLLVYYFYPKSPLMLYSLTTKAQTDAWAKIYETMKSRYKNSLIIGFIGYLIISLNIK